MSNRSWVQFAGQQSMHSADAAEREKSAAVVVNAELSSSSRKGQFAFRRDALVLFFVALDAIPRITDVAIRFRHKLAHFIRTRHRSLQHPWHKYHGLPNEKLVLHGENPFGDGKNERKRPIYLYVGTRQADCERFCSARHSSCIRNNGLSSMVKPAEERFGGLVMEPGIERHRDGAVERAAMIRSWISGSGLATRSLILNATVAP
jgi:hypothetical protein